MGGFVVVNTSELANQVSFNQNACGTALAPFDCWLFLRGIKTMSLRVRAQQANAQQLAEQLQQHPAITEVFYLGLDAHAKQRERQVHLSQAQGAGSVLSFTTGSVQLSQRFCDACRIFKLTVSFGSVNSLCEMVCQMSHASIDEELRTLPPDLVRLSVGIEDVRDLRADIAQALELALSDVPDIKAFLSEAQDSPVYDSKFEDLPVIPESLPSSVNAP
eukprot:TRINITY_DN32985_c0_g1_i1.p1 TRINITY_DN32985_c0_g1~~TRINITY_DN32985_c0_g1_i1.p1  ORF type:complete len:218 (-),score=84.34 TRINITY_DN32985_c0_g1_i1:244-897(-)